MKTLEEPPSHALFILATTETDKIPETVVSRCQVFTFKKPNREILKTLINKVSKKEGYVLENGVADLIALLGDGSLPVNQRNGIKMHLQELQDRLKQHDVWRKIENERDKRQASYVKESLQRHANGSAGLMIGAIKAKERARMLSEKQVTFAIMKYGREGLDEQSLDTVFVCEPMSQRNSLQQLMGRVLRIKPGKKQPMVMFFEDNIGPMIGMCTNLRRHLNAWPLEDGGPFTYSLVGHPRKGRGRTPWAVTT